VKRVTAALFVLLWAVAVGHCQQAQTAVGAGILTEGNAAYQRGDFETARKTYQALLQQGYDGATVLFNLGNAELATGRVGAAIACYLRAQRLAPRDRDIRTNLQRAWHERVLGEPAPPAMWLHAVGRALVDSFTLSELAVTAAFLYWLAAAILVRYLQRGRGRRLRLALWAVAALLLVVTALAVGRWWLYHHIERGVLTVESCDVRGGPGESFEIIQRVQDGRLVRILRSEGNWLQVVVEGGARGWLPSGAVTVTQP